MKNFSALPLSEERIERLRTYSQMYQRFSHVFFEVVAVAPGQPAHVLVSITYEGESENLTTEGLLERARDMFAKENDGSLVVHYIAGRFFKKHALTEAGNVVFRLGESPFAVEVVPGEDLYIGGRGYDLRLLAGEVQGNHLVQLKKWLKSNVIRGNLTLRVEEEPAPGEASLPKNLSAARPIELVLEEIFSRSPLPHRLRTPKKQWLEGRLRATGKIRIVEEYAGYDCAILCLPREPEEEAS